MANRHLNLFPKDGGTSPERWCTRLGGIGAYQTSINEALPNWQGFIFTRGEGGFSMQLLPLGGFLHMGGLLEAQGLIHELRNVVGVLVDREAAALLCKLVAGDVAFLGQGGS